MTLITDALFEAAAVHYDDVLPTRGSGRSWFRMVGGRTTTVGTPGGFSLLKFEHDGQVLVFSEKGGNVDRDSAAQTVPSQNAAADHYSLLRFVSDIYFATHSPIRPLVLEV